MATQGIYAIVNISNNDCYIGSSVDCENRFRSHLLDLRAKRHINPKLQAAWNKYGESTFRFEIREIVLDINILLEREDIWLPLGRYNIATKAGKPPGRGRPYTDAERAALSASRKGKPKPWLRGKKQTSASNAKRSAKQLGQRRHAIVGEHISAAKRGKPPTEKQLIACRNNLKRIKHGPHSAEHRKAIREALNTPEAHAKMSASQRGKKQSSEHVAKRVTKQLGQKRSPDQRNKMRAGRFNFLFSNGVMLKDVLNLIIERENKSSQTLADVFKQQNYNQTEDLVAV